MIQQWDDPCEYVDLLYVAIFAELLRALWKFRGFIALKSRNSSSDSHEPRKEWRIAWWVKVKSHRLAFRVNGYLKSRETIPCLRPKPLMSMDVYFCQGRVVFEVPTNSRVLNLHLKSPDENDVSYLRYCISKLRVWLIRWRRVDLSIFFEIDNLWFCFSDLDNRSRLYVHVACVKAMDWREVKFIGSFDRYHDLQHCLCQLRR